MKHDSPESILERKVSEIGLVIDGFVKQGKSVFATSCLKNLRAEVGQITIVGMSGGGYAALGHLATSTGPRVRTYAAWCSITDVEAWYRQLNARGEKTDSLLACCRGQINYSLQERLLKVLLFSCRSITNGLKSPPC